jgi:transcriptional regulator with XRE-family HTH domain
MKTEQAAFAERLHKLLAEKRIEASRVELVQLLARHGKVSVTPQTVSGWLNGSFMPRLGNMRALAIVLGVDLQALQSDAKPRRVNEPSPPWSAEFSGKDQLALKEFATLPAPHRKLVRELIAALASAAFRFDRS